MRKIVQIATSGDDILYVLTNDGHVYATRGANVKLETRKDFFTWLELQIPMPESIPPQKLPSTS